jgi:hypothetical protein
MADQNIDYDAYGVPVIVPDVTEDEFGTAWRRVPWMYRMSVLLLLPVLMVARLVGGTRTIWTKAMEVGSLPSDMDEQLAAEVPELGEVFGGERDRRLVETLQRLSDERGTEAIEVAVVYGAQHVPAMVHGLADRCGYIARSADWLMVASLGSDRADARAHDRTPTRPDRTADRTAGRADQITVPAPRTGGRQLDPPKTDRPCSPQAMSQVPACGVQVQRLGRDQARCWLLMPRGGIRG